MADLFYFTSPRKPIAVARYRPSARRTPKVVRKRRAANTQMFDQRACIASYEDPVFGPSNTSSQFLSRSILHHDYASARDTFNTQHSHDMDEMDGDDEHEESGGTPLPPSERPHMIDDLDDIDLSNASMHIFHEPDTRYDSNARVNSTHDLAISTSSTMPGATIVTPRRRSHGGRRQSEVDMEGDGWSTRSALVGAIFNDSSRLNDEAASFVSRQDSHSPRENGDPSPTSPITERSAQYSAATSALQSMSPLLDNELQAARLITDVQHTHAVDIDEDALAVDDPRRHYDVADFMDIWRLHSLADKRLPSFEPGIQSSIRLGRPPEQVTRDQTKSGTVDMQGIRWQMIGPSRDSAFVARSMLHPSSVQSYRSPSLQERWPPRLGGSSEGSYRFRAFVPKHRASFEHYQLRNVLAATDRNNIFYGTAGDKVMRASLACPTLHETVMNLSKPLNTAAGFRITCLSASLRSITSGYRGHNVLIVGGFYGEYAVHNVDGDQQRPSEGFVTHAYNGVVTHVHNYQDRRSGLLRAAFCSNDRQVRLMDLHNLQFTNTFTYETAVNCSATSPDGRLRVLVGDTTETLITDAERGLPLVTLKEHTDHAFGCAWSPNGRHVATAAQDGRVVIWDARNWKQPLRTSESVMSCARSLSFTDCGALVAAENEDVATVFCGRSFEDRQEIRFFGSIAGVALLEGGAELVIANADRTLGGLLTFERRPQGLAKNAYTPAPVEPSAQGGSRWRNGKSSHSIEILPDILL